MDITLELLAPAGNADIGIAAIDHGADAVYIGAPKFSARADAGVGTENIARLITHAHLFRARVYVALNTILTDKELPEALEIINEVFQLGADGLIIQDMGLLGMNLPPMQLIASTQMHNNTIEKVQFIEKLGFKRVILPRELSLEDIAAIRRATSIELEVFVHGALCVSYSGQCYMSQAATGRSGNRGVCAQPCRSRYTLLDGNNTVLARDKFLLSLKDLNLLNIIPELVAAGVTSFKIEGRYKGVEYVKNVTAAYRQAIDRFIGGHGNYYRPSSGTSIFTFSPDPDRTFNRGYTQYFINGRKDKVASVNTQKSIGQYVGVVREVGKEYFIMSRHNLQNGDGLCYFTKENELEGFRVDRTNEEKIYPNAMKGLAAGVHLYRNHDAAFLRVLNKASARREIAVTMNFTQEKNSICLVVKDEDGNEAREVEETAIEPSRNPAKMRMQVETRLRSMGNTPYLVTELVIHPAETGFLPVGVINGIRRRALDRLSEIRIGKYRPETVGRIQQDSADYPETKLGYHANVLNRYALEFYKRHGVKTIEDAFETLSDMRGKKVMTTRYCIRYQLDLCPGSGEQSARLSQEPFRLVDRHHAYRLEFDCTQCQMLVIFEK